MKLPSQSLPRRRLDGSLGVDVDHLEELLQVGLQGMRCGPEHIPERYMHMHKYIQSHMCVCTYTHIHM